MNKQLVIKSIKDTIIYGTLFALAISLVIGYIFIAAKTTPWVFLPVPIGFLYWACYADNKAKLKREGKL